MEERRLFKQLREWQPKGTRKGEWSRTTLSYLDMAGIVIIIHFFSLSIINLFVFLNERHYLDSNNIISLLLNHEILK